MEEINRIKNLRKTNKTERLTELGTDPDVDAFRPREAEVAFAIEEQYGFFKRYKRPSLDAPKGDWISLENGKTYDHFGIPDDAKIVDVNANLPKQREKLFENLDKHFEQADFVVLDIEHVKKYNLKFYEEIMTHIKNKFGTSKLIEYK